MCGIFGYWDRQRRALPDGALTAMAAKLAHRGPDDEGQHIDGACGMLAGKRISLV